MVNFIQETEKHMEFRITTQTTGDNTTNTEVMGCLSSGLYLVYSFPGGTCTAKCIQGFREGNQEVF